MSSSAIAQRVSVSRVLLGGKKRRLVLGALVVLIGLVVWWMVTAGAVTVFRIVYYNQTGIEDFKNFPSRDLHASSDPASFRAGTDASDTALPRRMIERIEQLVPANDSVAFLVVRNNTIVFEGYYDGWTKTSPSQSFSMAKSFVSMLMGAAIDDGYIGSVNDVVTKYVPELADRGFGAVTIEDLLQMSSGSNYVENENPFSVHARFTYTPDLEAEILRLKVTNEPGEWDYKSGDTALLTLILDRALAPKTVTDYTQERLWSPLGMESAALWTVSDDDGLEKTWCCIAATARDYAKLGGVFLRDGRFRGEQIVPRAWVERSVGSGFTGESVLNDHHKMMGVWSYNYHWWLVSQEDRDFMAAGHGGQFLYVNPSTDTIIVRLGKEGDLDQAEWIELFRELSESS